MVSSQLQKHLTFISSKLELVIWSPDTGQQMPSFNRCQLTITGMSNIKEGRYTCKPRLHVSVDLLAGVWPLSCRTLLLSTLCCRRHCSYVPTSNTASHDNREKINSWVSFSFLYVYEALLGGSSLLSGPLSSQSSATKVINPSQDIRLVIKPFPDTCLNSLSRCQPHPLI